MTLTPEQIAAAMGWTAHGVITRMNRDGVAPVSEKRPGKGRPKYVYRVEDIRAWVAGQKAGTWGALDALLAGGAA